MKSNLKQIKQILYILSEIQMLVYIVNCDVSEDAAVH